MLTHLQRENLGWAKNMNEKFTQHQLESDWEVISRETNKRLHHHNRWKCKIQQKDH